MEFPACKNGPGAKPEVAAEISELALTPATAIPGLLADTKGMRLLSN